MLFSRSYVKDNEEKLYNGEMIRDIALYEDVKDITTSIIITAAYARDFELADKVVSTYGIHSNEAMKLLSLLAYGFSPDFGSIEEMQEYLSSVFKAPKEITITGPLIKRICKIKQQYRSYIGHLTNDELYSIAYEWDNYTCAILENYIDLDILHDPELLKCDKAHAILIGKYLGKVNNPEDKLLYSRLNRKADLDVFKDQIECINSLVQLRKLYNTLDDPEYVAVENKYSHSPTILINFTRVKRLQLENLDDKSEAQHIASLLKFKLADIACKYSMDDIDTVVDEAVSYCMSTKRPIAIAEDMCTKVSRLRSEFPFLKETFDRLEDISLKMFDRVVDQMDENNRVKAEERKKAIKKKKEATMATMKQPAIEAVKAFVSQYAEATISVSKYCAQHDIDPYVFNKYVDTVEKYDEDLYLLYKACTKKNAAIAMNKMISAVVSVIDAMKNKKRFSLYDYYTITKFEPSVLIRVAKVTNKITDKDLERFRRFYSKKALSKPKSAAMLRKGTYTIKGKELSSEDVSFIIKYMKKNRYPYYDSIFMDIARKYVAGNLIEQDQEKQ